MAFPDGVTDPANYTDTTAALTFHAAHHVKLGEIANYLNSRADDLTFRVTDPAYGALGDGTTNDTAAIQAAIDACHTANGGIVWFPPGDFKIAGTLATYEGVTLAGCGYAATNISASTNAPVIKANGGSGTFGKVHVRDMSISQAVGSSSHGIELVDIFEFSINRVQIIGAAGASTQATSGGWGIKATGTNAHGIISDCVIGAGCGQGGIWVAQSQHCVIADCIVHENYGIGVQIDRCESVAMSGTICESNNGGNVNVVDCESGYTEPAPVVVHGCSIWNSGGVVNSQAAQTYAGMNIVNSKAVLSGVSIAKSQGSGIFLRNSSDCVISGSSFSDNGKGIASRAGIWITGTAGQTSTRNLVTACVCYDRQAVATQAYGVFIEAAGGTVTGNHIVGISGSGNTTSLVGGATSGNHVAAPSDPPTITGSRGSNAALANLLTALAAQGVIIDSTT